MPDNPVTRRRVLQLGIGMAATMVLAACGDDDDDDVASANTSGSQAAPPTNTAVLPSPTSITEVIGQATPASTDGDVQVLVGDVVDYGLEPVGWEGPFGWVQFKLQKGFFDGKEVWYIRTDSSDPDHAQHEGLVFVPLLSNALRAEGSFAKLYVTENGTDEQGAIVTTVPTRDDYTPAFRIHRVSFTGAPELLTSEADLLAAEGDGRVTIEATNVVVNYPLVSWPGGSLPVDPDLVEPLGKGPLVEEIDLEGQTVTFKLHQCFPGSRYIVTDTSAVPMAPMMGVVGSAPTQQLKDAGAVAPITIFLNGLEGPGVMGFQPAIFNEKAGHPAWSPFWDHFAVEWKDPSRATVVRSQAELDQLVEAGTLIRYNGVPDTHPNGFVVNCPAPILASNTYTGE